MNILQEIVHHKIKEVQLSKERIPIKLLEESLYFNSTCVGLSQYITRPDLSSIIAEIKRKSPSENQINNSVDIEAISIGYMQAGASALSVLTDNHFFGGANKDLTLARKFNYCPILRKDFIIDEYQIIEARSIGADAILLIANILDPIKTKELAQLAKAIGLEVLLEIHSESELAHMNEYVDVIGVNNRDLDTFKINMDISKNIISQLPKEVTKISESGLSNPRTCYELINLGYDGFLIGSHFMRHAEPHLACQSFIQELNKLKDDNLQ